MKLSPFKTIDEYIVQFPPQTQEKLQQIRALVHQLAPKVTETISYGIPTFKLNGKNLVHMAGYDRHIGFYPGSEAIEVFAEQLKKYKTSKGTVQFPLDEPLPVDLLRQLVLHRTKKL
jgi:uncharacterized protein YdhG (YjbR/CyaY superfamily)